ncbi:hypothetical protein LTR64_002670 [Lithohypha guttulata]|uniref:uncharacterized protein n=1 Tax=Lithohypha guttulata TaxID=1690604 RepID=UPI00315CEFC3
MERRQFPNGNQGTPAPAPTNVASSEANNSSSNVTETSTYETSSAETTATSSSDATYSSATTSPSTTAVTSTAYSSATTSPATTAVTGTAAIASSTSSQAALSDGANSAPSKSEISTATVAGAAVGAAIGAALLAALITWFFMRKRNHNARRSNSTRLLPMGGAAEKDYTQVRTREIGAVGVGAKLPSWMSNLPQPVADDTLRMNVRTLFHQIELHVENLYADVYPAESSLSPDILEEIEEFDNQDLPAPILTLIRQTNKPTSVIKRALAQHIVSNISVSDMKQSSFLPVECTSLAQGRRRAASHTNKPGSAEAFAQWRVLTAYLRPEANAPTNTSTSQLETGEDLAIRAAAHQFSSAFAPWLHPGQSAAAVAQNLEAIMRSAAQVGLTIFSQPAEFAYAWGSEDASRQGGRRSVGRLVVTPALLKMRDDNSRQVNPAAVIVPQGMADL